MEEQVAAIQAQAAAQAVAQHVRASLLWCMVQWQVSLLPELRKRGITCVGSSPVALFGLAASVRWVGLVAAA